MRNKKRLLMLTISIFYCISVCGQTQNEMNANADKEYYEAERQINKVYQQILKDYSKDTLFIKKLRIAQRLWIRFRDADLEMKFPDRTYSGSIFPMCYMHYKKELTNERIEKLKQWLNGTTNYDACNGSLMNKE